MKKVIITIAIVLIVAGGGLGYYLLANKDGGDDSSTRSTSNSNQQDSSSTQPSEATEQQVVALTVDNAIDKLKSSGFEVGDKRYVYYQMVDASNGGKVDVNGITTELYEFETRDGATKAQEQLGQLTGGSSTVFSIDSFVVIVRTSDNSIIDSIKKALQ